jgi:hypothetical protein
LAADGKIKIETELEVSQLKTEVANLDKTLQDASDGLGKLTLEERENNKEKDESIRKTKEQIAGLNEANQQLALQKSALLLVKAEYKGTGDSAQKFNDINNALNSVMDAQKQKITVLVNVKRKIGHPI